MRSLLTCCTWLLLAGAALAQAPVPHSSRLPPTRRYAVFHALSIPFLDFEDVRGNPRDTVQSTKRTYKDYRMEKIYDKGGRLIQFIIRDPDDPAMELKAKFTYRGDSLVLAQVAHKENGPAPVDRFLMFRVREDVDSTLILPTIFRGATFRQVVITYYKDGTMKTMEVESTTNSRARLDFKYIIRDPQWTEVNVTPLVREGAGQFATVQPKDPVLREILRYNQSYTMLTRWLAR